MDSLVREYLDETFQGINSKELKLEGARFENCTFSNYSFPGASLRDTSFFDCRFETCDLNNSNLTAARLRDVIFLECKLIGLNWTAAALLSGARYLQCALNFTEAISLLNSLDIELEE